ncbi:succinoglycan biosynthesis protein ExoM [Jannaschia faecimaris]|uniref:Succinoglycan biosynthesis protein ExoM n=1 Tax=Jannaschia faecimaris TaxID=1244108 RepID=A0A1H3UI47_9RHOB|nr:glycosyltransferase family 2 protein [Jannaschia faecimaris]SDZ61485.1 succinoglycan biosynthesis protein ExoM [Jannaschia faecimaris]
MKIDVCICTFRRPHVAETLRSVAAANRPADAALRLLVIDNDDSPSARALIEETAESLALPVHYVHAPGANISIARNAGLAAVEAGWVAFLDDDEIVDADWLTALVKCQAETRADAVFGQSRAIYGSDTPDWIVAGDFHSQAPVTRDGVVETGHTCNALLRWGDAPWTDQRFALERGRSGGEDTEFFFRLATMGARYAISADSIVREAVPADRASLEWLLKRRFRIGQSYASHAKGLPARAVLFASAAAKSAYCHLHALPAWSDPAARAFWLMRGRMHAGVCAGCLKLKQRTLYGA